MSDTRTPCRLVSAVRVAWTTLTWRHRLREYRRPHIPARPRATTCSRARPSRAHRIPSTKHHTSAPKHSSLCQRKSCFRAFYAWVRLTGDTPSLKQVANEQRLDSCLIRRVSCFISVPFKFPSLILPTCMPINSFGQCLCMKLAVKQERWPFVKWTKVQICFHWGKLLRKY